MLYLYQTEIKIARLDATALLYFQENVKQYINISMYGCVNIIPSVNNQNNIVRYPLVAIVLRM